VVCMSRNRYVHAAALLGAGMLLGGCATYPTSEPPHPIQEAPAGNLQLGEAEDNVERHIGARVRWGGTILSTQPGESGTWIRVEEHGLDSHGRPRPESASDGAFLVRTDAVLDPEVYAPGRWLTVAGVLKAEAQAPSLGQGYWLPVMRADAYYLWQEPFYTDYAYHHDPYRHYPHHHPHHRYRFHYGFGFGHH